MGFSRRDSASTCNLIDRPVPAITRSEVDESGRRFRTYEESERDFQIIRNFRSLRCEGLRRLFTQIAEAVTEEPCALSCRVKRTDTIVRKLRRESSMDLSRMEDIVAFRIIVPSPLAQRRVQEILQSRLDIRKVRNYSTRMSEAGYRATHLVLTQETRHPGGDLIYNYPCEIQLRTFYQHLWATTSESFGEQVKEGGGTAAERRYLEELAERIQHFEDACPEELQTGGLVTRVAVGFSVIVFNKQQGTMTLKDDFGDRLADAVQHMLYLEDRFRADLSHETVLLGFSAGDAAGETTHLRYFRPRGIPDLPDVIRPSQERPEQ